MDHIIWDRSSDDGISIKVWDKTGLLWAHERSLWMEDIMGEGVLHWSLKYMTIRFGECEGGGGGVGGVGWIERVRCGGGGVMSWESVVVVVIEFKFEIKFGMRKSKEKSRGQVKGVLPNE